MRGSSGFVGGRWIGGGRYRCNRCSVEGSFRVSVGGEVVVVGKAGVQLA